MEEEGTDRVAVEARHRRWEEEAEEAEGTEMMVYRRGSRSPRPLRPLKLSPKRMDGPSWRLSRFRGVAVDVQVQQQGGSRRSRRRRRRTTIGIRLVTIQSGISCVQRRRHHS